MPYNLPDIRMFDDLPAWLKGVLAEGRIGLGASGPGLTQGWLRQQLNRRRGAHARGVGSGTLSNIVRGERKLGPELAEPLAEVLELDGEERACFFDLVALQSPERMAAEDVVRARARLRAARLRAEGAPLGERDTAYLEERALTVLHALISTEGFRPEPAWIAMRLRDGPTEAAIPGLLQRLRDLGAVEVHGERWVPRPLLLERRVGDAEQKRAIIAYHEAAAARACQAMHQVPSGKRHIQTTVFAVAEAEIPALKARLSQLLGEFDRERGPEEPADTVYQVQVSLVPLTEV